jgi:hypothetical protein
MKAFIAAVFALSVALTGLARADEGMWTFDNFPSAKVAKAYGFTPSKAWLDHVSKGALRIAGGCSASFVSPHGLIMTNHHCAIECINSLSTATSDVSANGFFAKTQADEAKCPGYEIDQLSSITNVTKEMLTATAGKTGAAFTAATRAEEAKLQKACGASHTVRCDVVSLYHGGIYDVYKYNRFRDIRLVMAPEFAVAQFGGDPDNFNFPRFDLDMSFIRAYVDDKPANTPDYLHWSKAGTKAGDVVFVAGNPGNTSRLNTVAQLDYSREVDLPRRIAQGAEIRGRYLQYQTTSPEAYRQANDDLFFTENSYKVWWGQFGALNDPAFYGTLAANERDLRAKINANPTLRAKYASAFDQMQKVQDAKRRLYIPWLYKSGAGMRTAYFGFAQTLVRLPVEKAKPNAQRLPEFSDSSLVTLPDEILDPTPIYPGVEEVNLSQTLLNLVREFGPADPFVKTVLDGRTPMDEAHYLVTNTKLGDVAYRKSLLDGGAAAIAASTDPFILLAQKIDKEARAERTQYENNVQNPTRQLSEQIAKARFAITGTSVYPDATFTLRLSYGKVAGFTDDKGAAPAYTTIGGLFDRANGADPYALPRSWLTAKSSLNLTTQMNVSTTNDIIGGNSGSPLIDKNGEVVGLVFDGNIHSLGGAFGYDPRLNRATSVDSRVIIESLRKVYNAARVADEIQGN